MKRNRLHVIFLALTFLILWSGPGFAIIINPDQSPATAGQPVNVFFRADFFPFPFPTPYSCLIDITWGDSGGFGMGCNITPSSGICSLTNSHTYASPGTYTITARSSPDPGQCVLPAGASIGPPDPATFILTVVPAPCPALSITTSSQLPQATAGQPYSTQIQASGGVPPITFSEGTGTLPPGLSVGPTGIISGVPTTTGSFGFTIVAEDSCSPSTQSDEKAFSITVNPAACPPLSITTSSPLPSGTVGTPYSRQIQTSGGDPPVTFSLLSGSLPPGLSIGSSGLISGTPSSAGTFNFTVRATDSCLLNAQTADRAYSLTINPAACPPLSITTSSPLPSGTVGTPYSRQIQTSGGDPPVTLSLLSGSLPPGLNLGASGLISGNPTSPGTFNFTVRATDSCLLNAQTADRAYTLTVNTVPTCQPLIISTPSPLPSGTIGQPYNTAVQISSGEPPVSFALLSGSLPAGLNLIPSGLISGTPASSGTFNFTIRATDSCSINAQTADRAYTLTVNAAPSCPPLGISTPSPLPSTSTGQPYNQQIQTTGGQPPVSFSLLSGNLPPGMTLTPTGLISGAATSLGTFSFTVQATDSCPAGAQSAQKAFSLSVIPFSLSLTLSTTSVKIPSGSATTQNIGYTISATPPTDITLQSNQGRFFAGSTLIEQVNTPLTVSVINGIGRTTEILNIPVSVTKRAEELGVSNITYERTFTDGAVSETAQVSITVTTEAAAELKIQRLQLYFENRRAEITVKRNDLQLKAYADIRYTGTGLLEGFWEVDGRLLSQVKKHIVYGTSITIETPVSPPIPTFETGTHRLRFVITSPAAVSPLPESIYFVAEEKFEKRVFPVRLVFPLNNSVIAFSPATFRWEGIDGAAVYIIEFFEEGKEKPAFSAYMKRAEYSLPPPALKTIFVEGRAYRWKVKVFDKNRNMAGESSISRFRFR